MTRRTIRTAATCSVLALAAALAAPAAAQSASGSFQGTPTVTFGNASVTTGSGTTDVQVDSNSAVIDWSPFDTTVSNGSPILFQPAGTTATFHNNPTAQNGFAVLNRIVPADATRPIIFDGTVISRLQTGAGQVPGGTVFFYSPGGIVVGSNAVFDVGNLGLTTAPPAVDASGNWYTGNQVQFGQAASGSSVNIQGSIVASAENSYVAAFAPFVDVSGSIDVNGQAALVAAEAGTITFSPDGLFDIQISIGSDGNGFGEGVFVDGEITGPASSGPGDNHRIYLVAVPKNSLLSVALGRGASVGFDVAGAADTVGNSVVLSAGRNIVGGNISNVGAVDGGIIDINDSSTGSTATGIDFTSNVIGSATDNVTINVFRQTNFASNAELFADDLAFAAVGAIPSDSTGSLNVTGNFTLSTTRFSPVPNPVGDAGTTLFFVSDGATASVGGTLALHAFAVFDNDGDGVGTGGTSQLSLDTGSSLDVSGDLLINASSFVSAAPSAPDALGGNAQILLFGASGLDVGGVTRVASYGIAGDNNGLAGAGADGTGGFSGVYVAEGSTATFNELNLVANAVGGADAGAGPGDGFGGSAQITVDGAGSTLNVLQANVTGNINFGEHDMVGATGVGGSATGLGSTVGGTGTGGFAGIAGFNGATINLPTTPTGPLVLVLARGLGGTATAAGTTGGLGVGGDLSIFLDNATLAVENLLPSISGVGGNAGSSLGTINGGDAVGGSRFFHIVNGSTFTGSVAGGSSGAAGGAANANGTGGDGSGGSTFFELDASTLNVTGTFIVIGQVTGGDGRVGGDAVAGSVDALITNGSTVNIASGAEFSFSANAFGGDDPSGNGTIGGSATGGTTNVTVEDSTVTGPGGFGAVSVGVGGLAGAQGGSGTGGTATITINNSNVSVFELAAIASGTGGDLLGNANSAGGTSGNALGGSAGINLTNSTIAADILDVRAEGTAGIVDAVGFTGLTGGSGTGGTAFFQALGGTTTVTTPTLHVDSQGAGGRIFEGNGTGGNGTGGQSFVRSSNGNFTINGIVEVVADGDAGSAADGGTGGSAFGGNSDVTAGTGGSLTINGELEIDASAGGGDGTTGGAATAGSVVLNADAQSLRVFGPVLLTANADGGSGTTGAGGAAGAGSVLAIAQNGGLILFGADTNADAFASGGASVDRAGGSALGGNVTYLATSGGTILLDNPNANLTADSQAFGGSASGAGNGGDATAGSSLVNANGGAVTITGSLGIAADATGGSGVNGGSASGSADILVQVNAGLRAGGGGSVQVGGITGLSSLITGGSGANGGTGGDATGGTVRVGPVNNTTSSLGSEVVLQDLIAVNEATGGAGGLSATGQGGAGGDAIGGFVSVAGSAGNGTLVINGASTLNTVGTGGAGGDGAVGGAGGSGAGGGINFGTVSGLVTTDNTGSALFVGDVTAVAEGVGGDGGAGSSGAGGDGGDGTSGSSYLLVRGSPVTLNGTANLIAYGIGGDGGAGASADGIGGDGLVGAGGGIGVLATNRFEVPANRGTLNAGDIVGQAVASGGAGSTAGASLIGDTPALFSFVSADGTIATVNFDVFGTPVVGAAPSEISLTDATVDVGNFSFSTPGDLVLALDSAVLNTDFFLMQAREIVLPASAPTLPGTVVATSGLQIFVNSGASIRTYTNFETGFGVDFVVDGDFQTGDFTAAGDIFLESLTGTVTTGDLTGDTIGLTAAQGILAGDIDANGDIILQTDAGTISVGALSGNNVSVSAPQNVVIGDFSSDGDVVLESLSGSLTTGNLAGVNVDLFAATSLSAQNITASGQITAEAGGAVTVNGQWQGTSIFIGANDLAIASTGQLRAPGGEILLFSSNPGGMFVGDGTAGSGFVLDNSEFGRIFANDVAIGTFDTSAPIDMTIGNLTISPTQIGGVEESGVGFFVVGSSESTSSSGGIRVNGNIVASGFGDGMEIEFDSALFELNAATGSVVISGSTSGSLAGEIEIEATHIHVASNEILLKLRENPLYEGRAAELNQPAQVQRPDGVLRARGLVLYPESTLYIQNTGTAANPAGFYTTVENSDIEPPGFSDPSAPPVDVVINGRFQTASGDVGGREAFDLLIANAESSDGFTPTSQINACAISTSTCSNVADTPSPTNTSEIQALTEDQAEEEPFETEDEEEAEDEASSPITPPVVLINSRPLNPDVDVTDPVSGTGNPALIDATLSDDSQGDQQ